MGFRLADRVKQTSTTTGTGDFSVTGSISGYQKFRDVFQPGDATNYVITDGVDWEVGECTIVSHDTPPDATISRDRVLASSNANDLVNWGAGTKEVFVTLPAQRIFGAGRAFAFTSSRYNN